MMKKILRLFKWLAAGCGLLLVIALAINFYIIKSTEDLIINAEGIDVTIMGTIGSEEAAEFEADCILVLGAGLKPDGTPNFMLQERLDTALALYKNDIAPKLLQSVRVRDLPEHVRQLQYPPDYKTAVADFQKTVAAQILIQAGTDFPLSYPAHGFFHLFPS